MMVAQATPWGIPCGVAKHLSYWLPHFQGDVFILGEHPPKYYGEPSNNGEFRCERCWRRGEEDAMETCVRKAKEHGASILHLQFDPSLFPFKSLRKGRDVALELGIKTVATAHVLLDVPVFKQTNKGVLSCIDQVVGGTPGLVQALASLAVEYHIPMKRPIKYVPLPYPDLQCTEQPQGRIYPRILTWGMMGSNKGHLEVIEAVEKLKAEYFGIGYIIMGEVLTGEQKQTRDKLRIQEKAGRVQLQEGFFPDSEIETMCKWADVIVLNHQGKWHSSSGTVVLSVASGTPVVVSNSPMFSGYVEAGAVKVAEPGVDGMVAAIREVLVDASGLEAGREVMVRRTSPKAVARAYEGIYEELLA